MIYLLVYSTVGIPLLVFRKWLFRKHPTFEDILDRVGDSELKRIESMQYPDGLPFSVRSARFVRNAIELLVVILCWPVLAVILLRRFSTRILQSKKAMNLQIMGFVFVKLLFRKLKRLST